jgi:hypothetical protein
MRLYLAAAGFAVLACDGSAPAEPLAPAFAATVTHFRISAPLGFVIDNPCTGSEVTGSFQVSTTATEVLNPSGRQRLAETFRARGSGTDADGTVYSLHEVRALSDPVSAEAVSTGFTLVQTINAVSQGGDNNFQIRALIQIHLNAAGDLVASIDRIERRCRG